MSAALRKSESIRGGRLHADWPRPGYFRSTSRNMPTSTALTTLSSSQSIRSSAEAGFSVRPLSCPNHHTSSKRYTSGMESSHSKNGSFSTAVRIVWTP